MSKQQYILALDQGTTSSRAIVFDAQGNICGSGSQEFPQYFPQPGWVEHDVEEIWQSQQAAIRTALQAAKLKANQIAALGITNQRETILIWDRQTGMPLHKALVWQDRRTTDSMQGLDDKQTMVRDKTGLLLDPYFSAAKLEWLLDNVAGAREKAEKGQLAAGTIDSFLVYRLTKGKEHITDMTNACRTLLFNIHSREWDEELLELFNVPKSILPRVVLNSGHLARTHADILDAEIDITGMAGDQHAALCGQLCTETGMVKNTYGTGCFMLTLTGDKPVLSNNRLLTTIAWALPDQSVQYALEGSIFIGGAAIQWLRDGLELIDTAAQINDLAAADNNDVYLVPAFTGLGAPYWDPRARGMIIGITRGTKSSHIARATLESIAFQSTELAHAMQKDCGFAFQTMRADGGATASSLLMQIQADLLDIPIKVPKIAETTALGAAYFAGLGKGIWQSFDEIATHWQLGKEYVPKITQSDRDQLMKRWQEAVARSRQWAK